MPVRLQHGRHRQRVAGPVTMAFRAVNARQSRLKAAAVRAWPAVPALVLVRPALHGSLTAYADSVLGFDAVLCLIACLCVTPFITVAKLRIAKLRWWYGMWVFVLGAAGLGIHLAMPPGSMVQRAAGDAVNWTGLLIVVLLFPMAATSCAVAQKLMGPEWKRWQRGLIWVVWSVTAVHLLLMHAWLVSCAYAACTLPAVTLRMPRVRKAIKQWRGDGYSTGGWWAVMAVLGTVAMAGLVILATEEVRAAVRAITLA